MNLSAAVVDMVVVEVAALPGGYAAARRCPQGAKTAEARLQGDPPIRIGVGRNSDIETHAQNLDADTSSNLPCATMVALQTAAAGRCCGCRQGAKTAEARLQGDPPIRIGVGRHSDIETDAQNLDADTSSKLLAKPMAHHHQHRLVHKPVRPLWHAHHPNQLLAGMVVVLVHMEVMDLLIAAEVDVEAGVVKDVVTWWRAWWRTGGPPARSTTVGAATARYGDRTEHVHLSQISNKANSNNSVGVCAIQNALGCPNPLERAM
jgi:hypothetical protein